MLKDYITQQDVDQYELLYPLLEASYVEIQELSKKKPESPLNSYKVKAINRILIPLKELLKDENVYDFLDVLDTDDLPTNSDVVLILSQYKKAMVMFRDSYYKYNQRKGKTEWSIVPDIQHTTAQSKSKQVKIKT